MARQGVIFEITRIGGSMKMTAIDPVTLVEVSVVGPAHWDESTLRRNAMRKLEAALARRHEGGDDRR
jgi:hypothetical protein